MVGPHIFEIESQVWNALADDEISASVEAMKEFGIYQLPYDSGEIILRVHHPKLQGHRVVTEIRGLRDEEGFIEETALYPGAPAKALNDYKRHMANFKWEYVGGIGDRDVVYLGARVEGKECVYRLREVPKTAESLAVHRAYFRDILVVLLASKGLQKVARKSGLAKLGIGKRAGEYITTLRLEQSLSAHENVRPGHPVRPHLRRGHVRSQRYGEGNSLVKRIWIEPCFVNADADFVSERKSYRVIN